MESQRLKSREKRGWHDKCRPSEYNLHVHIQSSMRTAVFPKLKLSCALQEAKDSAYAFLTQVWASGREWVRPVVGRCFTRDPCRVASRTSMLPVNLSVNPCSVAYLRWAGNL